MGKMGKPIGLMIAAGTPPSNPGPLNLRLKYWPDIGTTYLYQHDVWALIDDVVAAGLYDNYRIEISGAAFPENPGDGIVMTNWGHTGVDLYSKGYVQAINGKNYVTAWGMHSGVVDPASKSQVYFTDVSPLTHIDYDGWTAAVKTTGLLNINGILTYYDAAKTPPWYGNSSGYVVGADFVATATSISVEAKTLSSDFKELGINIGIARNGVGFEINNSAFRYFSFDLDYSFPGTWSWGSIGISGLATSRNAAISRATRDTTFPALPAGHYVFDYGEPVDSSTMGIELHSTGSFAAGTEFSVHITNMVWSL